MNVVVKCFYDYFFFDKKKKIMFKILIYFLLEKNVNDREVNYE